MTRRAACLCTLSLGLLLACSPTGGQEEDQPAETGATVDGEDEELARPYIIADTDADRMYAEPEVAAPGDAIEVYFPEGDGRGPHFVLERRVDDEWAWDWVIHSDTADPDPNVMSADEYQRSDYEWESGPGFHGEGPHRIPVPEEAVAGEYRVCTAGSSEARCAEFRADRG